jgi:hypothetical protein
MTLKFTHIANDPGINRSRQTVHNIIKHTTSTAEEALKPRKNLEYCRAFKRPGRPRKVNASQKAKFRQAVLDEPTVSPSDQAVKQGLDIGHATARKPILDP